MAFSFIEIEEQKNRVIILLFAFLVVFYFFAAWLLIIPFKLFYLTQFLSPQSAASFSIIPTIRESLIALGIALAAGSMHWALSTDRMVDKVLKSIGAHELDKDDTFHQKLKNIVDEVSVAVGGRPFECRVIATRAANAFAVSDFSGRNVLGVTEGLLAKLNRAQLEAVIGHEAAHLVCGDSKLATVSGVLFGLYSSLLEGIKKVFKGGGRRGRISGGRGSGGIFLLLILVYLILLITRFMSHLMNMFLSRQKEYRADAVSVRLTRNPVALAEALHLISRGWHGQGLAGEHLSTIFIISPGYQQLDETEGWFADLFSTHPPVKRRIGVLLNMAHAGEEILTRAQERASRPRLDSAVTALDRPGERWFAVGPAGEWLGPFTLDKLKELPWLKSDSWVKKESSENIKYAYHEEKIRAILQKPQTDAGSAQCPKCKESLGAVRYEGAPLFNCRQCGGYLAKNQETVSRILLREQQGFSAEVERMAGLIERSEAKALADRRRHGFRSVFEYPCPVCGKQMQRRFYNYAYAVEIDACMFCGAVWFDKDELEILQLLAEKRNRRL